MDRIEDTLSPALQHQTVYAINVYGFTVSLSLPDDADTINDGANDGA